MERVQRLWKKSQKIISWRASSIKYDNLPSTLGQRSHSQSQLQINEIRSCERSARVKLPSIVAKNKITTGKIHLDFIKENLTETRQPQSISINIANQAKSQV